MLTYKQRQAQIRAAAAHAVWEIAWNAAKPARDAAYAKFTADLAKADADAKTAQKGGRQ